VVAQPPTTSHPPFAREGRKQRRSRPWHSNRLSYGSLGCSWRRVFGSARPPTPSRHPLTENDDGRRISGEGSTAALVFSRCCPKTPDLGFPPPPWMLQSLPRESQEAGKRAGATRRSDNATQQKDKHHAPRCALRQFKRRRTTLTAQQGHASHSTQRQLSRRRTAPPLNTAAAPNTLEAHSAPNKTGNSDPDRK
jgi:hypothetical protein